MYAVAEGDCREGGIHSLGGFAHLSVVNQNSLGHPEKNILSYIHCNSKLHQF